MSAGWAQSGSVAGSVRGSIHSSHTSTTLTKTKTADAPSGTYFTVLLLYCTALYCIVLRSTLLYCAVLNCAELACSNHGKIMINSIVCFDTIDTIVLILIRLYHFVCFVR